MRLSVQELKNLLKQKRKKVCGKKEALVERLIMANRDEINTKIKKELIHELKGINDPTEEPPLNLYPSKMDIEKTVSSMESSSSSTTITASSTSTTSLINKISS
jgi:hypothetical protein